MGFIEELKWRGMLHDMTPNADKFLDAQPTVGYIGFDPTAPSMTIGNFVQLQILRLFQKAGHSPIVLMGGATGRIGDPSGKDKERELKTEDELDRNLLFQHAQAMKFLDFEGPNPAIVVNNYDFYKDMNVLEFLRTVGKTLTVSYMMSKDSVKNRLESGLSFTEFSYQLLQAYDFQVLYQKHGCRLQMGGSDQWGNITSGTEFIRRNLEDAKAYAVTTPLLTKSDGKKFGKSEEGNIWLDPNMTSAYKFYQFWINADDADINKFLRYFSLKEREEIQSLEDSFATDPRGLKTILAEELTARVHSSDDLDTVQQVSEILFSRDLNEDTILKIKPTALEMVGGEIPAFEVDRSLIANGVGLVDLMTDHTSILTSKSDGRRAIQGNAVSVNKAKVTSLEHRISLDQSLHNGYLLIENGKKNKYLIKLV